MEYTIEITSYCKHDCSYCSTNATECGDNLPLAEIKYFIEENGINENDTINISGGEPLAHPKFYQILQLCKSKTKNVWVYTNELTQIKYNTSIIPEIKVEANVCLIPGESVYIPKNADKVHLLQLIPQGRAKDMKPANIHISGNCTDKCKDCEHKLLQADGKIVSAPCKKNYESNNKHLNLSKPEENICIKCGSPIKITENQFFTTVMCTNKDCKFMCSF